MNALQHMMHFFSWNAPLGRGAFLGSSLAASLAFAALLMLVLMTGGSILPNAHYTLFFCLLLLLFLACTASPFVAVIVYFFSSALMWLPTPELPIRVALPLFMLFSVLLPASLLRLIALAVRRRRDAGLRPTNYFAFSSLFLGLLYTIGISILIEAPYIWLAGFALCFAAQCCMLFQTTAPPALCA